MDSFKKSILILGILGSLPALPLGGQTPEPVVHAVLFYSPTCPHCHQVINETLIPLQNRYGKRLVILGMDTSQQWASNLYWEAIRHYKVPEEDWAVPFLLVGEEVLVGGLEIPNRFPTIIEEGLAAGGIDLPNFPALVTFLQEQGALDPRYPDRLIALQAQAPEGEEPSDPGDSAARVAGGAAEAPPEAPAELPTEVLAEVPADSGAVRDSAQAAPLDSALQGGRPAPALEESEGGVEAPGRPEARDSLVPSPVAEPLPATPPALQEAEPQDSAAPAMGVLGLAEAVREMDSMTVWDRFNRDRAGNSVSVLVLLGMVLSLVLRGYPPRVRGGEWPSWVIPALVLVGVGVAGYLTFIEVTQAEAVCGPVGDCNTVNQSEYARLFGVLPVGVLGLIGYAAVFALWVLGLSGRGDRSRTAALGLWGAALAGTLFSVYLTFLEPFVIGATCAWCLTSAVVMTLLLWATAPTAARAWPDRATDFSSDRAQHDSN
jgi:uncharacterized membrane protein/thiol-disulfide isomerase/thioredoxin